MANIDIKKLKSHWKSIIQQTHYRSQIDVLSEEIGKSSSYLRGMLNNKSIPSADVCLALSARLGCPISEFFNASEPLSLNPTEIADKISKEISKTMTERLWGAGKQPTGDDVMSWWLAANGRLENFDFIDECFDLFEVPSSDHRHLIPFKLGKRSLASISLETNSHDVFNRTVRPLDESYRRLILTAHRSSIEKGPMTSIESLDAIHPDTGTAININYTRTLVPVVVAGRTLVLNYSKLVRVPGEVSGHVRQINPA